MCCTYGVCESVCTVCQSPCGVSGEAITAVRVSICSFAPHMSSLCHNGKIKDLLLVSKPKPLNSDWVNQGDDLGCVHIQQQFI